MATKTETKAEAWKRLAIARSRKANGYLESLCKLANRSHYEWTDQTVSQLIVLLFRSVLVACDRYKLFRSVLVACDRYKLDPQPLYETAVRHNHLGVGFDR